jgi:hypothetical protein
MTLRLWAWARWMMWLQRSQMETHVDLHHSDTIPCVWMSRRGSQTALSCRAVSIQAGIRVCARPFGCCMRQPPRLHRTPNLHVLMMLQRLARRWSGSSTGAVRGGGGDGLMQSSAHLQLSSNAHMRTPIHPSCEHGCIRSSSEPPPPPLPLPPAEASPARRVTRSPHVAGCGEVRCRTSSDTTHAHVRSLDIGTKDALRMETEWAQQLPMRAAPL